MAPFVYKKYNSQLINYSPTYELQQTGFSSGPQRTISGRLGYSFDSTTGIISYSGGASSTSNGSRVSGTSDRVTQEDTSPQGWSALTLSSVLISSGGYYWDRGSYIGQVIAENGTYPGNGRHTDGFWYERMFEATAPILTYPNGGETFSDQDVAIAWTHSLTGFMYRVELSLDNGATWSTLATVSTKSCVFNFANTTESSLARIRITPIKDSLTALADQSDGVFTVQHNVAPAVPTNLQPTSRVIDRTKNNQLSWQHNDSDSQSKADLQWRLQGSTTWTTVTSNGNDRFYIVAANTFPAGVIEWRVRTYDSQLLASPWSSTAVFTSANPTTAPVITEPASPVSIARPTITWTSVNQQTYQALIIDALNATVWDSGEVSSTNKAVTVGADLVNGATYTIKVRVKDSGGLFSSFAEKIIQVSYTPPTIPSFELTADGGFVILVITNPSPTGSQPQVIDNWVYRKDGESWTLLAMGVTGEYQDNSFVSGADAIYKVRAIGDNGTFRESGEESISPVLLATVLSSSVDKNRFLELREVMATTRSLPKERTLVQFEGRPLPIARIGGYRKEALSISWLCETRELWNDFVNLTDESEPLLYRDPEGRKLYASVDSIVEDDVIGSTITRVSFTLDRVDFKEGL